MLFLFFWMQASGWWISMYSSGVMNYICCLTCCNDGLKRISKECSPLLNDLPISDCVCLINIFICIRFWFSFELERNNSGKMGKKNILCCQTVLKFPIPVKQRIYNPMGFNTQIQCLIFSCQISIHQTGPWSVTTEPRWISN